MPTCDHELPLELIGNQPQLAPELLRTVFGVDSPIGVPATLGSESFADFHPAEFRCDATVLLGDPKKPKLGIVVESQLKEDKEKRFSWPAYLSLLRSRLKCPVTLLVICPDQATARKCATPIDLGHPNWVLSPLTLHPGLLPAITDAGQARRLPELAVLSTPAHADGPDAISVIDAFSAAIDAVAAIDPDTAALYHDYVASRLSEAARKLLEEKMKLDGYEWQSDFARRHIAEGEVKGKAKGEAKSILLVLDARGIPVSKTNRERITECTDLQQLERWVRRAATVDTADQLFN